MKISYDLAKRALTLANRGLDFDDASKLFERRTLTVLDDRMDYGEVRFITYGWLDDVAVALVWTQRSSTRRIISMRRMHEKEIVHVGLDRP